MASRCFLSLPIARIVCNPLDVSVFGPFKKMFYTQCQAWMKNHIGRDLELHHIAPIADKCLDACTTPKNIKSGFRATVSPDGIETVAHKETTSEVTTSKTASTSLAPGTSAAVLRSALQDVGPLKHDTPAKKSKRGRKSMETTILTLPQNVANLHKKAEDINLVYRKNHLFQFVFRARIWDRALSRVVIFGRERA
ncbi:uncharacterized protein LOC114937593 [Nylanderia fulva]|uniref:uncharacterized protein LOC114937593 n=1 Tax=Nylanderia fulva TaxID=613905 RepID=UPI0010FBA22E|nr:uncharacterized protein LOC114937593 [Nylanderia fulva]